MLRNSWRLVKPFLKLGQFGVIITFLTSLLNIQNLLHVMMAADGHPEVRQKIYLMLWMIVNAVGSHPDCFEPLLNALLKGIQDENDLVQSIACSVLGRVLVR